MLRPLHANPNDLTSLKGSLVSFRISNGAMAAKELPKRLKLLNWGVNETVKGPVTVGAQTVAQLSANQAKLGYDRIALDFNHQSVPGSDTFKPDPVEVAAYGTPVVIPNDGLYLENIEWTPAGEKYASNYHDLSPTPKLDAQGEVVFLHSVALCRQGAVKDLSFYNASFLKPLNTPMETQPTTPMATPAAPASTNAPDYRGLLIALLGKLGCNIPDTATDADIGTMVDQFKAPAPPAAPAGKEKEAPAAPATPMSVEARLDKMERDNLLLLAANQGKVVPLSASEIDATPVAVLRGMIEKLPAGAVPTSSRQGGNPARPEVKGKITTLTAEQQKIARNLQISEEKYLKQLNAEAATNLTVL